MIVMPALRILSVSVRVIAGGSVRGMWTSLNVICVTPSVSAISSAWSSANSRIEYDATPSVRGLAEAGVAPLPATVTERGNAAHAVAAAAVPKNARRDTWLSMRECYSRGREVVLTFSRYLSIGMLQTA